MQSPFFDRQTGSGTPAALFLQDRIDLINIGDRVIRLFFIHAGIFQNSQQGMDVERTANMVRNWKSRKYVYQISDISFRKCIYLNQKKENQ